MSKHQKKLRHMKQLLDLFECLKELNDIRNQLELGKKNFRRKLEEEEEMDFSTEEDDDEEVMHFSNEDEEEDNFQNEEADDDHFIDNEAEEEKVEERVGEAQSTAKKNRKSYRQIKLERNALGFFRVKFVKIKENDAQQFFVYTRMNKPSFDILLGLVQAKLMKKSVRQPLQPELRLAVTLIFLTQGDSVQNLASSFKIGIQTARRVIFETSDVLWQVLSPLYVSEPNAIEFEAIANDFWSLWNMPNCLGAIGIKKCEKQSSIVLMAVCNANYTFTHIDVGVYGTYTDRGIFKNSKFGQRLIAKSLPILSARNIPGTDIVLPNFFVGDAACPLSSNLMRPYPGVVLDKQKEIFNKRLSRAHRTIENALGILVARWPILLTTMHMIPENAEKIVLACVGLHNFLMLNKSSKEVYCPSNYVDVDDSDGNLENGLWRAKVGNNIPSIAPSVGAHHYDGTISTEIRTKITKFFNSN